MKINSYSNSILVLLQCNAKTVHGTNDRCSVRYAHESSGRKSVATLTLVFDDLHELFLLIYVKNQKSEFEYLRLTTIFYKFRWHQLEKSI